jgi:hypothetical protein
MGSDSVLMSHVAPGLGVMVACALFASPIKAVLGVKEERRLGSLNPLPFCAMLANCVAWLVYAFLTGDPYVLASNIPGVLIALWLTFSCYGVADDKVCSCVHTAVCVCVVVHCPTHQGQPFAVALRTPHPHPPTNHARVCHTVHPTHTPAGARPHVAGRHGVCRIPHCRGHHCELLPPRQARDGGRLGLLHGCGPRHLLQRPVERAG